MFIIDLAAILLTGLELYAMRSVIQGMYTNSGFHIIYKRKKQALYNPIILVLTAIRTI